MLGVPNGSSLYGEINQMNTYKKSTPSNHEYMEEYFHSTWYIVFITTALANPVIVSSHCLAIHSKEPHLRVLKKQQSSSQN